MRAANVLHAALLLASAALLAACAGTSRPKPAELPPNPGVIGAHAVWNAKVPAVNFPLEVRVVGSQVIVAGGDGTVLALDAASGRELSRASAGAPLTAGVGSDGQTAAVVTRTNEVVALAAGSVLWRHKLKTQSYTAPLVAGGRVFVLGADRSLTALDGRNGAELWRVDRPGEPLVLRQAGVLTAVGNTLVVGFSGRLAGVNPDNGSILWEAPIASPRGTNDVERLVDLVAGVVHEGSVMCARAFQAAIGCVDTADGRVLWSRKASGATGIAGDDQRLFGSESDGRVVAWGAEGGSQAWASDTLKWRTLTGTLALGRSVVVGDGGGWVHFLARDDGRLLDRLATDGSGIAATPVAAGNVLVVVTRSGGVFGFSPG